MESAETEYLCAKLDSLECLLELLYVQYFKESSDPKTAAWLFEQEITGQTPEYPDVFPEATDEMRGYLAQFARSVSRRLNLGEGE